MPTAAELRCDGCGMTAWEWDVTDEEFGLVNYDDETLCGSCLEVRLRTEARLADYGKDDGI